MTTVEELIIQLQGMNPEAEVYIAYQPKFPLEKKAGEELAQSEDGNKSLYSHLFIWTNDVFTTRYCGPTQLVIVF